MNYQQARGLAARLRKTLPPDQKTVCVKGKRTFDWTVRVEDVNTGKPMRLYMNMGEDWLSER